MLVISAYHLTPLFEHLLRPIKRSSCIALGSWKSNRLFNVGHIKCSRIEQFPHRSSASSPSPFSAASTRIVESHQSKSNQFYSLNYAESSRINVGRRGWAFSLLVSRLADALAERVHFSRFDFGFRFSFRFRFRLRSEEHLTTLSERYSSRVIIQY